MSRTTALKRKSMGSGPIVVTHSVGGLGQIKGLCTRGDGSFLVTTNTNKIRRVTSEFRFTHSKIAGCGGVSAGRCNGDPFTATFDQPRSIITDLEGNALVADTCNNCIRKLNRVSGAVTTWAGTGEDGYEDGAAGNALFSSPRGLALLPDGAIAVSDCLNHCVRVVSVEGVVRTLCGGPLPGNKNGAGATACFSMPHDIVVDRDGNLLASLPSHIAFWRRI